jgi:RNA polymerase sigma factor (sigma-70 family)
VSNLLSTADREEALTNAVKTHEKSLLSLIRGKVQDKVEAEDIVQEVFEEFLEAYELNTVIGSLGSWLYAVARNKIVDRFRRKKTESSYREKNPVSADAEKDLLVRPDTAWMSKFLQAEILTAIELLPEEQRVVFVQHELEGKSFLEIAAQTGASVNTLISRKRYALTFLRKHLKETYDELE